MRKHIELIAPHSCLNKALPDEPLFVLRANDPLFAATVRLWAAMAYETHEHDKIDEALRSAEEGAKWFDDRQPNPANQTQSNLSGADALPTFADKARRR